MTGRREAESAGWTGNGDMEEGDECSCRGAFFWVTPSRLIAVRFLMCRAM
jgi:hypothetical protein